MSTEVEQTTLSTGASGEVEEPLAARLVECALDDAMHQMLGQPEELAAENGIRDSHEDDDTEKDEEEERQEETTEAISCSAEPIAQKLVEEAVEEAVEEVGRHFLSEAEQEDAAVVSGSGDHKLEKRKEDEAPTGEEETKQLEEEEEEETDKYMDILGNGLLRKKTLVPGKGRDTRPLHGDSVTVSYVTYLADTEEEVLREEITFVVGDGDVIQALDLAVALSELQEEFELTSDARFAFGKKGFPPRIPANASLRFIVHLKRCDEPPSYATMTPLQQLSCANQKRERGNFLYERDEYALSINSYNKALEILNSGLKSVEATAEGKPTEGEAELREEEVRETKIKIYNNMAAAQIRIEAFEAAVQSCDEVLKLSPANVKALFRRGKAKVGNGEFAEAVRCLRAASRLEPDSRIVQTELNRVLALVKRERETQQKLYRRMFGSGVDSAGRDSPSASPPVHSWRRFLWYGAAVAMVGVSVALASAAIKFHQHP